MKFLFYTNFSYYRILNKKTNKKYHGILDVKKNQIMFNTDEDIDTFIPYSNNAMLIITPEKAYKICIIYENSKDGQCLSECASNLLKLDLDGNICTTSSSCSSEQYLLIPELVCSSTCDSSVFVSLTQDSIKKCGLCKDLYTDTPYKLINSTECLNTPPDNSEVVNSEFYLLQCKKGYQMSQDKKHCIPHCYITCVTCEDYTEDENIQNCLSCNSSYYLEDKKCKLIQIRQRHYGP